MFQFSGLSAPSLYIQPGPIRESWDQSPFVGSPRLFADFHALHRLLVPRHPPCALSNLTAMILSSPNGAPKKDHLKPIAQTFPGPHDPEKHLVHRIPWLSLRALWRSSKTLCGNAASDTAFQCPTSYHSYLRQIVKEQSGPPSQPMDTIEPLQIVRLFWSKYDQESLHHWSVQLLLPTLATTGEQSRIQSASAAVNPPALPLYNSTVYTHAIYMTTSNLWR